MSQCTVTVQCSQSGKLPSYTRHIRLQQYLAQDVVEGTPGAELSDEAGRLLVTAREIARMKGRISIWFWLAAGTC